MNIATISGTEQLLIIQVSIGAATTTYRYLPLHKSTRAVNASLNRGTSTGCGGLAKFAAS